MEYSFTDHEDFRNNYLRIDPIIYIFFSHPIKVFRNNLKTSYPQLWCMSPSIFQLPILYKKRSKLFVSSRSREQLPTNYALEGILQPLLTTELYFSYSLDLPKWKRHRHCEGSLLGQILEGCRAWCKESDDFLCWWTLKYDLYSLKWRHALSSSGSWHNSYKFFCKIFLTILIASFSFHNFCEESLSRSAFAYGIAFQRHCTIRNWFIEFSFPRLRESWLSSLFHKR